MELNKDLQKLCILFIVLLVVTLIFAYKASAAITDNILIVYNFSQDPSTGPLIDTAGLRNATPSNMEVGDKVSSLVGDAWRFDGSNEFATLTSGISYNTGTTNYTSICLFKPDSTMSATLGYFVQLNNMMSHLWSDSTDNYKGYMGTAVTPSECNDADADEWVMVTTIGFNNNQSIHSWINNTACGTSGSWVTDASGTTSQNLIGKDSSARHFKGDIDECYFWSRDLTTQEIEDVYNNFTSGIGYPFTPPAPTPDNESLEQTAKLSQGPGFVQIPATSTYQTIFFGSFNFTANTSAHLGAVLEAQGLAASPVADCRVLIDNTDHDTQISRTLTSGDYASLYLSSANFTIESGEHNASLECRNPGTGNYRVRSSELNIYFLTDSDNESMVFDYYNISESINNADYTLVRSENFTASNENLTTATRHIILDASLLYNYTATNNISVIFEINNTNCTEIPRYGTSGTTGSVASFCVFEGANNTVPFNIYAKGTGNITGNVILKEMTIDSNHVNSTTTKNLNITSSSFVTVANLTLDNDDHATHSIVAKASLPTISNSGSATVQYRLAITSENGTTIRRSIGSPNQPGVTIIQDIFENVGSGVKTLSLEASCDNNNCTITGGDFIAYFADSVDISEQEFNVTLYDQFTSATINEFNVTISSGLVFSTSTGLTTISPSALLENLTLQSNNYFNRTFTDYNVSNNLNASMRQAEITFQALELITGNILSSVTFYVGSFSGTQFNLTAANHSVTAQKSGYFNLTQTIEVLALENTTKNLTGMYNGLANITLIDGSDNTSINNYTITTDYGQSFTTTNGTIFLPLLQNTTSYLNVSAPGYATLLNTSILINQSEQDVNITMWTFNSVRINIFNESNLEPLLQTVTISTISNLTSFINTTATGFIVIDFLVPNSYELRFESSGFNPRSLFLSVTNDSTQNITVYMTENTTTELQVIEVLDTSNSPVEGAIVWLQKQIINESEQYITVQESMTDFNGKTTVWVERDTTIFYRFAVIVEGAAKPIQPSGNLFTGPTSFIPGVTETVQIIINLEDEPTDFISDSLAISHNVTFSGAGNRTVTYTFIDGRNSITGGRLLIEASYINETLAYEVISNQTALGSSGTINYTIPEINNSIWRITAYVTYQNSEEIVWQGHKRFDIDVIIDKYTGLLYGAIILAVVALLTVTLGPLPSGLLTVAAMIPLSYFKIIDIPTTIITSILAIVVIFFLRTRKLDE